MSREMFHAALNALDRGESFALVSVIEIEGSSPGKPGQKMIVYPGGRQEGTVGGGRLEIEASRAALDHLARGKGGFLRLVLDPDADDSIGAVCGGTATLAIEVFPARSRVLLCGAGHVARAVARQFAILGLAYAVVDQRPDAAVREEFPDAAEILVEPPSRYLERGDLASFTHIVILTHSHKIDQEALRAVHKRGYAGYVGMIGSRRKWAEVRSALIEQGVPAEWCGQVHCPIGIEIGARTPAEIAVSIAAEILQESSPRREATP